MNRAHRHTTWIQLHTHTQRLYLLVCLHLAAYHSEGVSGGVVVDLDPAEDLGPRAGRDPLLIGFVIDHHRGPRLTDARLTERERERERERKKERDSPHTGVKGPNY